MTNVLGKPIIQADIIQEIKKSHNLSISVDEMTLNNKELLSVFFWYINKNVEIKETFHQFIEI